MSAPRIGVIAAAGKGRRIHPRSSTVPKVMLEIGGKPLLARNVELLRDALGIRDIHIVIGHLGDQIRAFFGDGTAYGVAHPLHREPGRRRRARHRAAGDRAARAASRSRSSSATSSTWQTNHAELRGAAKRYTVVCAVRATDDVERHPEELRASRWPTGASTGLVEKPTTRRTGPYARLRHVSLLAGDLRATRARRRRSPRTGRLELTDVIDHAARRGAPVLPFVLTGHYLNVNIDRGPEHRRTSCRASSTSSDRRVSLVIPAYNEAASIGHVVRDFLPLRRTRSS